MYFITHVVAPAMNTAMWNHPVTSEHLERITKWGYTVIEPISKGNLFKTMVHDLEGHIEVKYW